MATFRAQATTDKIHTVEERYSESDGPYQIAVGFDANGNAIRLCNRGFSAFPNYVQNVFTAAQRRYNTLSALRRKRRLQVEQLTSVYTSLIMQTGNVEHKIRGTLALARCQLRDIAAKIRTEYGHTA